MATNFDKYRTEIVVLLLDSRIQDPWTAERIAVHLEIPIQSKSEMKRFKRYIRGIIKFAEPGSPLSVVGNEGRGYYYPEYVDDAEKLKNRMVKIGTGFFTSAQKYEDHKKRAKKRPIQMTFDDLGVDLNASGNGST